MLRLGIGFRGQRRRGLLGRIGGGRGNRDFRLGSRVLVGFWRLCRLRDWVREVRSGGGRGWKMLMGTLGWDGHTVSMLVFMFRDRSKGIGLGFREILTMRGFDCNVEICRIERGNLERVDALRKVEENIVLR